MRDYPRPPAVSPTDAHIRVEHPGAVLADTHRAIRILETSQPPAFYLPPADVATGLLKPTTTRTFCEWKGTATYWSLDVNREALLEMAWSYPSPTPAYAAIADHVAFYPQRVETCSVDGERVASNPGSFCRGWVTSKVVGPFKGASGTLHW